MSEYAAKEQVWRPELYRRIVVKPRYLELLVHASLAPKEVKKKKKKSVPRDPQKA